MAKTLGIVLAVIALLALIVALGMLLHGFLARAQMNRYKASVPTKSPPGKLNKEIP